MVILYYSDVQLFLPSATKSSDSEMWGLSSVLLLHLGFTVSLPIYVRKCIGRASDSLANYTISLRK